MQDLKYEVSKLIKLDYFLACSASLSANVGKDELKTQRMLWQHSAPSLHYHGAVDQTFPHLDIIKPRTFKSRSRDIHIFSFLIRT